jgi:hypothetical protein
MAPGFATTSSKGLLYVICTICNILSDRWETDWIS